MGLTQVSNVCGPSNVRSEANHYSDRYSPLVLLLLAVCLFRIHFLWVHLIIGRRDAIINHSTSPPPSSTVWEEGCVTFFVPLQKGLISCLPIASLHMAAVLELWPVIYLLSDKLLAYYDKD